MYCQCPGIDFYISQKEMIKMLSPSQYSNIILVDGVEDFDFAKYIFKFEEGVDLIANSKLLPKLKSKR